MTPSLILFLYFVGAFVLSVSVGMPIIKGLKRLRAGQNILEYVVQHEAKAGTPTMGGVIFIILSFSTRGSANKSPLIN